MATKKASSKKTTRSSASKSKKSGGSKAKTSSARTRISPRGDGRFVRRNASGTFKESDDIGKSMKGDRRTKAKTTASKGQGDRGDHR